MAFEYGREREGMKIKEKLLPYKFQESTCNALTDFGICYGMAHLAFLNQIYSY
jgi:hypothetical protein